MESIGAALQLDSLDRAIDLRSFKRAFTDRAVVEIYEAIVRIWPRETDIARVLGRGSNDVAGLYVGDYSANFLHRAIVRHSTYASKILVVDPFQHPYVTADEYNPILNPGQHRAQTLRNTNLFLSLLPWIDAGLLDVIRTPADFDRKLSWEAMKRSKELIDTPELKEAADKSARELSDRHRDEVKTRNLLLSAPDEHLRRIMTQQGIEADPAKQDLVLRDIQSQRDADPNFLEPLSAGQPQLEMFSTGGTIEAARLAAQMSSAYLFTDIELRWKLIARDREKHSAEVVHWSPFAKAVQNSKFSFLNSVTLEDALRLRKDGRLNDLRRVMREAWLVEQNGDPFDDRKAIAFSENLVGALSEAESEWTTIKAELAQYAGAEIAAGTLAAGPLVASGQVGWLAGAGVALATMTGLYGGWKGAAFLKRFPAAFFMRIKSRDQS